MPLLEGWDEEKRREIIQRTPELYRKRGTAEGLKLALRLFADVKAEVHEGEWPYPGLVIGRSSTIGKDTVLSPPVFVNQCFTVELPDRKDEISRERLRTVQALVETEKPAHAHYALVFERTEPVDERVPFLHVGKTGRIGVDARIGGLEDVPATQDEEIQRVGVGRKQAWTSGLTSPALRPFSGRAVRSEDAMAEQGKFKRTNFMHFFFTTALDRHAADSTSRPARLQ